MSARFWFLLLMGAGTALAQRLPDNFDEQRAEQEGRELTAELLSQVPAGNYTNTGVLEIYQRGSNRTVEVPVRFTVRVHGDRWTSLYEALSGETNMSLTSFTILSAAGRPNRFYRGEPRDLEQATPLTAGEVATLRFAGSDFWVGDLGLEFLRWPVQRLLKKEMKRGQSCNVLESINPDASVGGYARVVSWLDIDTGGIVLAQAYDADRKRMKEFAPKSFKKVEGQWQLKEMRIEDFKSRSRTILHFEVGN